VLPRPLHPNQAESTRSRNAFPKYGTVLNVAIPVRQFDRSGHSWRPLLGPVALYLILACALLPFHRYMVPPDATAYITVARHYAQGQWSEAINTNWSPVFSWLMVPFVEAGVRHVLPANLVAILSGVFLLYCFERLARGFQLDPVTRVLVLYTAAFMVAVFALLRPGPDVLTTAILLSYFRIVCASDYPARKRTGLVCGCLGAAAFLTKGYTFYFFFVHFVVMNAWFWWQAGRDARFSIMRQFASGMIAFLLVSAPWIIAMSAKAGKPSLGTTGAWNYRLFGPDSPGYPQYYHLIPPPTPHGFSMWDQPAPSLLPAWSPFQSVRNFIHQARLIAVNSRRLVEFVINASMFSLAGLFAYVIWAFGSPGVKHYGWFPVLFTTLLLPAGYSLVIMQDRYLWSIDLLMFLAGAAVVQVSARPLTVTAQRIAISVFVLSFVLLPLRQLVGQRNSGKALYMESQVVRERFGAVSRLAGCGNWEYTANIAFSLGATFYGSTGTTAAEAPVMYEANPDATPATEPAPARPDEIARSLRENRIDSYLVWPSCRTLPPPDILTNEITVPGPTPFKLYRVVR